MKALVIGATGRVAGHLTQRLCEEGIRVRGLVRDPHKAAARFADAPRVLANLEIITGIFDDPSVLQSAYKGVDIAFLALGTSQQQIALEKRLIIAAAHARLPQLIRLSVLDSDLNADYEVARRHGELDAYLAGSEVPHTLLRPAYFASNLLFAAASIASDSRWYGSAPNGRIAMIDPRDVADAALAVICNPALQNSEYRLTGVEALSFPEVADRFTAVLGRRINYIAVDAAALRKGYVARAVPDWLADIAVGIDSAMQAGRHANVTAQLQQLTGNAPRTLDDFIRDHIAAFTAVPVRREA